MRAALRWTLRGAVVWGTGPLLLAALACASRGGADPPATGEPAAAGDAAAAATPAADGGAVPAAPVAAPATPAEGGGGAGAPARKGVIVLDSGDGGPAPTLGELSRAARSRPPSAAVPRITNDNLGDYARPGNVTVATAPAAEEAAADAATAAASEEAATDEAYWRDRLRSLREDWRQAADEAERLEREAEELRWRFYAAEDPWVRDGRIKPEWDRVLDRLDAVREEVAGYPRLVAEAVEEGRREGALPGWLREGSELEPETPADAETIDPAEPVEPAAAEEPADAGGPR